MEYRKKIESSKELAAWYDDKYSEMGDGWATPAEECNRHLDDLGVRVDPSKWLLDVGCGAGHFLAEAEKRVRCWGIDLSHVGTYHATKRTASSLFFVGSIENWFNQEWNGGFDYIVSMGSLEHIVDLGKALDNIRALLKPDGQFYFFCPNEEWKHFDQPNERTMTDEEWVGLFGEHGLVVRTKKRWNDNTAFKGGRG